MDYTKLVIDNNTEIPLPEGMTTEDEVNDFIDQIASMYGINPENMTQTYDEDVVYLNNQTGTKGL